MMLSRGRGGVVMKKRGGGAGIISGYMEGGAI